jgi:hypothetical protein
MLKYLLIAVLVVVAIVCALLIYASTKPGHVRFERSILIDAAPEEIYPLVEDFRAWPAWSPYENRDPDMHRTYSGAEKGEGAAYAWEGDSSIGSGHMEIVETDEPSKVVIALFFTAPMKAENQAIFTFEPEGEATRVTWVMEGEANLFSRTASIFIDMDKMVGTDFEAGLAKLKLVVEG